MRDKVARRALEGIAGHLGCLVAPNGDVSLGGARLPWLDGRVQRAESSVLAVGAKLDALAAHLGLRFICVGGVVRCKPIQMDPDAAVAKVLEETGVPPNGPAAKAVRRVADLIAGRESNAS